ncbi:putative adenine-specific DNA methylase [Sulfolobus tengchongensis spindle-shaped virus 3]|nr:putative adenine-specific DNA methylase [Sulfolobus tengchongensis spindle-shaped virus 3]
MFYIFIEETVYAIRRNRIESQDYTRLIETDKFPSGLINEASAREKSRADRLKENGILVTYYANVLCSYCSRSLGGSLRSWLE